MIRQARQKIQPHGPIFHKKILENFRRIPTVRTGVPGYQVGDRRRSIGELSLRLLPLSIDSASVRHPARFPATSLKFRTAGLPGYGFKRLLHPESTSARRGSKAPAYPPPAAPSWLRPTGLPSRSQSSSRSSCHDREYHESSTGPFLAEGYVVPQVLSTTTRSARLGATPRFHGVRLYGQPCPSRALQTGPKSFPALPRYP